MIYASATTFCALSFASAVLAQYNLAQDFSGNNFFNGFAWFAGTDWNLTNGDVNFLSLENATAQRLTYLNDNNRVIMKVDNTSFVPWNEKRNSVRIESLDAYPIGSLIIIDAHHLPYGCSVWPAFWTAGTEWPENGEIDIIEGVNEQTANQVALHTDVNKTCTKTPGAQQSGQDANADCATATGCTVRETKPNSYGASFAAAQGGVWATQFETSGIFIWFWSRADIPSEISSNQSTLHPNTWGTPMAAYPTDSNCNIPSLFGPQRIIIDITLYEAGNLIGVYNTSSCRSTTPPKTGRCYDDNVIGDGSNYANAYFEIDYVRTYTLDGVQVIPNSTTSSAASTATSTSSGSSGGSSASSTSGVLTDLSSTTTGNGLTATLPAQNGAMLPQRASGSSLLCALACAFLIGISVTI